MDTRNTHYKEERHESRHRRKKEQRKVFNSFEHDDDGNIEKQHHWDQNVKDDTSVGGYPKMTS